MSESNSLPTVHVLLATFNGAAYLEAQLDSLARQEGVSVRLYVSDDGSTDGTLTIVRGFQGWPVEVLPPRSRLGATGNFFRLLRWVAPRIREGEWVAFCDQDDIWHEDKLVRAVSALTAGDPVRPAAYGSRTEVIDSRGEGVGLSTLQRRPAAFANALVQCIAGANTLVFNVHALRCMLIPQPLNVPSHDWWCYQVVTGCGGRFVYDPRPGLRYRQHGSNEVGFNRGARARLRRLGLLLGGAYREWNGLSLQALSQIRSHLVPQAQVICTCFESARTAPWFWQRLVALFRSGVHRQSRVQSVALIVACCLRKL